MISLLIGWFVICGKLMERLGFWQQQNQHKPSMRCRSGLDQAPSTPSHSPVAPPWFHMVAHGSSTSPWHCHRGFFSSSSTSDHEDPIHHGPVSCDPPLGATRSCQSVTCHLVPQPQLTLAIHHWPCNHPIFLHHSKPGTIEPSSDQQFNDYQPQLDTIIDHPFSHPSNITICRHNEPSLVIAINR